MHRNMRIAYAVTDPEKKMTTTYIWVHDGEEFYFSHEVLGGFFEFFECCNRTLYLLRTAFTVRLVECWSLLNIEGADLCSMCKIIPVWRAQDSSTTPGRLPLTYDPTMPTQCKGDGKRHHTERPQMIHILWTNSLLQNIQLFRIVRSPVVGGRMFQLQRPSVAPLICSFQTIFDFTSLNTIMAHTQILRSLIFSLNMGFIYPFWRVPLISRGIRSYNKRWIYMRIKLIRSLTLLNAVCRVRLSVCAFVVTEIEIDDSNKRILKTTMLWENLPALPGSK